jgi:hypothetical protein
MSKKVNWAEVDKRIRGRRKDWSNKEVEALEATFMKLPDLQDKCDNVKLPQPALQQPEDDASN